jgi:hypothetical protein
MEKILLPEVTQLLSGAAPWMAIIISVILVLMLKDWAANIAKGIKFYRDPAFMPGDRVILDGENATIIDIGLTRTVFHIQRETISTWRYVPNTRIDYLKLEKVLP